MTRDEIIALVVAKAREHGLVPWEFLGGAIAESGLVPTAWRQATWPDWSAGLFQQTVKFADEGDQTASPENVALIKRLYFDPAHACDVAAAKFKHWRYNPDVSALQAWCAYNLPASYRLWPNVPNIEQRENYRAGLADAQRILGGASMPVRYNRNEPVHPQEDSFDCSQESLEWALFALGRKPQEDWLEPTMIAEGVMSRGQGLLDATGAGLAAFVRRHYGEYGYDANHEPSISWDWIVHEGANPDGSGHAYPVLIGGRGWNHWTAVRDFDPQRGVLLLANPADGWMGVKQTMTRPTFEALGPFSAVRVWHPDLFSAPAPQPEPVPVDPKAALRERFAVIERELAALKAEMLGA